VTGVHLGLTDTDMVKDIAAPKNNPIDVRNRSSTASKTAPSRYWQFKPALSVSVIAKRPPGRES
jgi:hypothetical protein